MLAGFAAESGGAASSAEDTSSDARIGNEQSVRMTIQLPTVCWKVAFGPPKIKECLDRHRLQGLYPARNPRRGMRFYPGAVPHHGVTPPRGRASPT